MTSHPLFLPQSGGGGGLSANARIWATDQVPATLGDLDDYFDHDDMGQWEAWDPNGVGTTFDFSAAKKRAKLTFPSPGPAPGWSGMITPLGAFAGADFVATLSLDVFGRMAPVSLQNIMLGVCEDLSAATGAPLANGFGGAHARRNGTPLGIQFAQSLSDVNQIGSTIAWNSNFSYGTPYDPCLGLRIRYDHAAGKVYSAWSTNGRGWYAEDVGLSTTAGNIASVWGILIGGYNTATSGTPTFGVRLKSFRVVASSDIFAPHGGWLE